MTPHPEISPHIRSCRGEILVVLVDVGDLNCLSDFKLTFILLLQSHDEAEESGLARTVGTDHAYDAVGRQHEVEVVEEYAVVVCLGKVMRFDHLVAETRTIGDEDLQFLLPLLLVLVEESVVA